MKFVLITGVSSGLGYDLSKYLLDLDYYVFGSVRNQQDAKNLQALLGENFTPLVFDVTVDGQIAEAKKIVEEKLEGKGLFALVNNAGIAEPGPLMYLEPETFKKQMEVNLFGVHLVTNHFLPLLGAVDNYAQKPGKIINISSVSGIFNSPFMGAYCISKHALESMSDIYRRELMFFGIDVIVMEPGPTKSKIWEKARSKNLDEKYGKTIYGKYIKNANKIIERSEKTAISSEKLVKKIASVLTSRKPKTRYIITKDTFKIKLLTMLPDRFIDKMIVKNLAKGDRVRPL